MKDALNSIIYYFQVIYTPWLILAVEYGGDEEFMENIYQVSSSDDKGRMTKEEMEEAGGGTWINKSIHRK